MRAVKLSNSWIQMTFDSFEQRQKLAKAASYLVPGYEHSAAYIAGKWDGTKCYLTPANKIHTGIFKSLFQKHPLVFDTSFSPLTFDDIPLYSNTTYDRREYQLQAINLILQHKRGLVQAAMGAGKSLISAACCSYHLKQNSKNKVLFVCYDTNILQQTISNYTKYGLNVTQFGGGIKDLSGDVVVATIQSLNNLTNPKKVLSSFTFLFSDEAHHAKAKSSRSVFSKLSSCEYYIGLTATPHKEGTLELAELMSALGPVIFSYGFTDAVANKNIAPVRAYFLKGGILEQELDSVIFRKYYPVIWENGIKNNSLRNKLISNVVNGLVRFFETPTLVYVDRVEHGRCIFDAMQSKEHISPMQMYGIDSVIARENKKSLLMSNQINTLISSVVKEGVDFAISPVVAVNASGREGFINVIQFLGRLTRANEKFGNFRVYIDIIDDYHPTLKNHSEARIQACKDIGLEVVICNDIIELIKDINIYFTSCCTT